MCSRPAFLLLALAAGPVLAAVDDPLKSAECVRALEAVQAQEGRMLAAPRVGPAASGAAAAERAALDTLRRGASRDCLGKEDLAVERLPRAPISVPPVTSAPPAALPAPSAAPPPVAIPPLRTVTQCDPSGCWTSDGIRLNRLGPLLVGPPGACTVQGGVLSCR